MTWAWGMHERRPWWQYLVSPGLLVAGVLLAGASSLPDAARGAGLLLVLAAILAWAWKVEE